MSLKSAVRHEVGKFSDEEFRKAYSCALRKYKGNPRILKQWCELDYYMKGVLMPQWKNNTEFGTP